MKHLNLVLLFFLTIATNVTATENVQRNKVISSHREIATNFTEEKEGRSSLYSEDSNDKNVRKNSRREKQSKFKKFIKRLFPANKREAPHKVNQEEILEDDVKPFHIGFVYPLSNHGSKATEYINQVSIHAITGVSKGLDGVEFSGLGNVVIEDVKGFQMAGFFNIAGGNVRAVQMAGFTNISKGNVKGAQLAGFLNYGTGSAHSGSLAGFANIRNGDLRGSQFSGFINTAQGANGVQAAGFINVAKDVKGAQIAGFINIARKVNGVQIGIINFADSVDGVPIGLFNFVKNGYRKLEFFATETFHTNMAFKFGVPRFYSIIAVGAGFQNDFVWGYGYGLGSQFGLTNNWKMSLDITSYHIIEDYNKSSFSEWRWEDLSFNNTLRLGFDKVLNKNFTLTFGPTFNVFISDRDKSDLGNKSTFAPYHVFNRDYSRSNIKMWPGIFVGIRL